MLPNYKSKLQNSLLQPSSFNEETVRWYVLSAKTGSFTTHLLAFDASLSNEITQEKCCNRKKELYSVQWIIQCTGIVQCDPYKGKTISLGQCVLLQ